MSELLQFIIVVGFGALCFGCGYLTGFIVTCNHWREMIKHGVARYNSQTGFWEGSRQADPTRTRRAGSQSISAFRRSIRSWA